MTDLSSWNISNGHISATGHLIHFMFGARVGFSGSADRMALLPVGPNPRWRLATTLEKFERPYLCNGSSDPRHVWFLDGVFGVGGSNGAPVCYTKFKMAAGLGKFRMAIGHISATGHPIHFTFGLRVGYLRFVDQMANFQLHQIQDGSRPPS